jgi:DNA-binding LacI/PurR family transcriptional regulator
MGWNPESERTFLEHVRRDRHQGLLAFCTSESPHNDDLLARMSQEGIRIIHIEHYREEPPDQNFILPDYRQAGRLAAEHLHKAGYRTIIFSHTQQDWPGARLMQQGFEEATRSSGEGKAPTYGTYVYPINDHLPECAQAIRNYMRGLSPSTGILCTNTFIANGIIAFAREAGLRCPDELGIVTAPWMDFHIPFEGLDTVEFDRTGYLLKALDAVMRPEWPVIREYAEPRIVRRGSTTGMRQKR